MENKTLKDQCVALLRGIVHTLLQRNLEQDTEPPADDTTISVSVLAAWNLIEQLLVSV